VQIALSGGGKTLAWKTGPMKPGASKRFTVDPGGQAVEYSGTLTVKYPPRSGQDDASMELHFVAEVVKPLAINVSPGDLDLQHGKLQLTANRPLGKAEVTLTGEDGGELASGEASATAAPPGQPFTVTWKPTSAPVLKLHLQVTDVDGFYGGLDLFPWRVDVPHQDVNFASGSAAIPPSESGKLDAALQQILPQVAKARAFADVRLFVVGHTDTVGGDASNQKLSEERARAIAGYFRAHGLNIGISYAGLGEKALLVNTPDETDEPRNRRAEYVLSVGEPTIAHASAPPGWKRL
jgi:outer membrane protein OmpA-like peptidoglycan-associated protein